MKKALIFSSFLFLLLFNSQNVTAQTTYIVTSTTKDGSGSLIEAINLANNNPGTDIIEFTSGLQVDAHYPAGSVDNLNNYMANITESVIIDGKGGSLNGVQKWVSANGSLNNLGICPESIPSTIILNRMPDFLKIGTNNADNSAVSVTIKNLTIKQFNAVADIRKNASLTLENFKANDIWSTRNCLSSTIPLITAKEGASLTLIDSQFINGVNWGTQGSSSAITSLSNASNLTIENCLFYDFNGRKQFFIDWNGSSISRVNIVSSRFMGVGGIRVNEDTSITNIVNSTWVNGDTSSPKFGDRIVNNSSGDINIIASSLRWNSNNCDIYCQASGVISLMESRVGKINIKESAIGFNFPVSTSTLLNTLGGKGNGFTADKHTWIQPTSNQNDLALQTITSQPNLITNIPGYKPEVITSLDYSDSDLLTPAFPGELIDAISTTLINPITNSPIVLDAIGNNRFDANGFRDIGAIQLSLAPFLTLINTGDGVVKLKWNEPLHHDNFTILRYEAFYFENGKGSPTIITVNLPNVSTIINNLTNGTEYKFMVRAVYDNNGKEENGPFSNTEFGIPYGDLESPVLSAISGNEEVKLSWNLPYLGSRRFESYVLLWRIDGGTNYIGGTSILDPNQTNTTINGLVNDLSYEFAIKVKASGQFSTYNYVTAKPNDGKILFYPNPVNNLLYIKCEKDFEINLFSINGKLLMKTKNNKVVDISKLSSGTYIIFILTENKAYSGKVIRE